MIGDNFPRLLFPFRQNCGGERSFNSAAIETHIRNLFDSGVILRSSYVQSPGRKYGEMRIAITAHKACLFRGTSLLKTSLGGFVEFGEASAADNRLTCFLLRRGGNQSKIKRVYFK